MEELITRLAALDEQEQRPHLQAIGLEYFGRGGSEAWRATVQNGDLYVVKTQNNGQDRNQVRMGDEPLKILTTELICGRLGQLFSPIVCPEVAIIDIPERLAEDNRFPDGRQVTAGPSFGSFWYSEMYDVKDRGRIDLVPPGQVARIIVFQTWLRGSDPAALVSADGRKALSIDHGYYLAGQTQWNRTELDHPLPVNLVQFTQYQQRIEFSMFEPILQELNMLDEMDILKAFAAVPAAWGGTIDFRAKLAHMVLQRRAAVEQVIATIWKGTPRW